MKSRRQVIDLLVLTTLLGAAACLPKLSGWQQRASRQVYICASMESGDYLTAPSEHNRPTLWQAGR